MRSASSLIASGLLLALASAAEAASSKQACKPFDAAEVRNVLRIPVGAPTGTAGVAMLSCTAQGGSSQVTLSHTLEPDVALGSEGEFQKSVAQARSVGRVEVREFKQTRCASLLASGGSKVFKAWCVLHSKAGRAVTLEVVAPSAKRLPTLEQLREVAEASAARVP